MRRRSRMPEAVWVWLVGWAGAAFLGMLNGVLRDTTYSSKVGEIRAHRISTATLVSALSAYMWQLQRRAPLGTRRESTVVGGLWAIATVAFEFGLGALRGRSLGEMAEDYDVRRGRVWIVVPSLMAVGPSIVRVLGADRSQPCGERTASMRS
jgi:hypothetical protein